jgi:hypothetical protein
VGAPWKSRNMRVRWAIMLPGRPLGRPVSPVQNLCSMPRALRPPPRSQKHWWPGLGAVARATTTPPGRVSLARPVNAYLVESSPPTWNGPM